MLPMNYIVNQLKAFRSAIKQGDLDTASACLAHLEKIVKEDLDSELDKAYEVKETANKLRQLVQSGALD